MAKLLKSLLINTLTSRAINKIGFNLSQPFCSVFMLHRFAVPEQGIHGHDPAFLRSTLEYLRKNKFNLLSAEQLSNHLIEGRPIPKRSVCFTLDDGFWDQAAISAPIFAEYDCPATYFLTTRFLDDQCWMWDSKVEYLFDTATDEQLYPLAKQFSIAPENTAFRPQLFTALINKLKECNEQQILATLASWAELTHTPIPVKAPKKYSAMNWEDAQGLIKLGMQVGPHSVTHPIIANETEQDATWQINQSWVELKAKIPQASPVFCYTVGRYGQDFGEREMAIVSQSNMTSAYAADPGFVEAGKQDTITALKRYGYPSDMADFRQYATWLERAKDQLRGN